ncbi:MAG: hypothetical protein GY862_38925 [Gammaproteobacteria bacterium]|nr:hypothetical protein [Gammaproteobacteria bacterium]
MPDRNQLLAALKKLSLPQFEEVLFYLKAPRGFLPPDKVELSTRAIRLLEWMEQQEGGLLAVQDCLQQLHSDNSLACSKPSENNNRQETHIQGSQFHTEGDANIQGDAVGGDKIVQITQAKTENPPPPDIQRLPVSHDRFFGRNEELEWLKQGQAGAKTVIQVIHGGPGAGKTALLEQYLESEAIKKLAQSCWMFAWSFYNQGNTDAGSSAEEFIQAALRFYGCDTPSPQAEERARELARRVCAYPSLLVLDGLEPLQYHEGGQQGQVRDAALHEFLRQCLRSDLQVNSLILISSRRPLKGYTHTRFADNLENCNLDRLSAADSIRLLHAVGVNAKEPKEELEQAAERLGGHPLSLSLLGKLLKRRYGGRLSAHAQVLDALREVEPKPETGTEDPDKQQARHAWQVLQYYDQEYWDKPTRWERAKSVMQFWRDSPELKQERLFLHLLGLLDRPMEGAELLAVLQDVNEEETEHHFYPLATTVWKLFEQHRDRLPKDKSRRVKALQTLCAEALAPLCQRLLDSGLLLPEDKPLKWDCHPLVRDYFGNRFREQHPKAYERAQKALYRYYLEKGKTDTQGKSRPSLEELEPFYRAVQHGCRAKAYQETLEDAYDAHIVRRDEGGTPLFYSYHQLDAQTRDLTMLRSFFLLDWNQPVPSLTPGDQAFLLNQVALSLMSQGRLREASLPMRAGMEKQVELQQWNNASRVAQNLCELQHSLGQLLEAQTSAEAALDYARRAEDLAMQMIGTAGIARTLHRRGQLAKARTRFQQAEALEQQRGNQYLSSLSEVWYCQCLLDIKSHVNRVRCRRKPTQGEDAEYQAYAEPAQAAQDVNEVVQRAEYALEISKRNHWALDMVLDHLSLARAHAAFLPLLPAGLNKSPTDNTALQTAHDEFDLAVQGIHEANAMDHAPEFHLARADFHARATLWQHGKLEGEALEACLYDLETAWDIIERGEMRLDEVDYRLLAGHINLSGKFTDKISLPDILEYWMRARDLIEDCDYHLRDGERDLLAARLAFAVQAGGSDLSGLGELKDYLLAAKQHIRDKGHWGLLKDWQAVCAECGIDIDPPEPPAEPEPPDTPAPNLPEINWQTTRYDWNIS